jgi:DNA-directed RNA polymerase specialized sigma subunit
MNFEKAVCDYLNGKIDKEKLSEAFYWLTEHVIDHLTVNIPLDRDDAIQEGVMICWEKFSRYDRTKGVAFNFFTTIILSLLRQIYRTKKNCL